MAIDFSQLTVGTEYERVYLAKLWGYDGWQALGRGAFTPQGQDIIILFITKENQKVLEQYQNEFDGETLRMEGEANHGTDQRLASAADRDQVHLFYRERHHNAFRYAGEVYPAGFILETNRPSRFFFSTSLNGAQALNAILAQEAVGGDVEEQFVPDVEGRKKYREHVIYERSRRNRARALEIHGTVCAVCGFDFNNIYGEDLARDFIEVHHTRSITAGEGPVDPAAELIPLCSNCHSMIHRRVNKLLSPKELKQRVEKRRSVSS